MTMLNAMLDLGIVCIWFRGQSSFESQPIRAKLSRAEILAAHAKRIGRGTKTLAVDQSCKYSLKIQILYFPSYGDIS